MNCVEMTEIHKVLTKTVMQLKSHKQQCLPVNFYLYIFAGLTLHLEV